MALNSNTMEFFRRLENNGTGSSKLGKIITTSKTVGSIASGSILSSNITFPAFIDSLFGSGDDMAMDVSPVRLEESSGEYIVDPTIVSHREVDEDGNPVESNFKIKLEVTPGSDLIECINIQKIITTTDPETGDSVSKKITVSTIKTAQASAPSETGVNDFIITVPCTKEDAAADEVKLRVVAYEYIIAPGGPEKPTPLPDEKPSNGQPSKVVEIGVTFGALQLTKAKLTSTQSSPVTNVVTGTSIDFPLTGEVVIGEDGLTMDDIVSLELFENGGSSPVATATDPASGGTVTYTATIIADASAPDRKVSVPYTLVATWDDGTTKEATLIPTVVAKEVSSFAKATITVPNPTRTNVISGTSETFNITGSVELGDDGRTRDTLESIKILVDDTEVASSASPATDDATYALSIEASATAPSRTVTKTVKVVATWADGYSSSSSDVVCKVVAKAPEKKIYTGFMMFPYSGCISYDGTKAVPMEDMTDATWPTPEAIAADLDDSGTGHSTFMPMLITQSGEPNPLIVASMTKHIDPDTLELVDGTTYSSEIFTETRKPSEMRDEIFNNRRPFIIGGGKYSLDSAEVTAMCSSSGYVTPVCTEEEKAYIADLVDGDPYNPPSNGEHPSTWGLGRVNYCFVAFPTDDFTLKEMAVAGIDSKTTDFATFDINGVNYTLRHIEGGIAAEPAGLLCTVKLERK